MEKNIFSAYKDSKKIMDVAAGVLKKRSSLIKRGPKKENLQHLVTCLDFFYKKSHSELELVKIITDGDGDLYCDAVVVSRDGVVDIFDIKESGHGVGVDTINRIKPTLNLFLESGSNLSSCNPVLRKQIMLAHKIGVKQLNLFFIRERQGIISSSAFEKYHSRGLNSAEVLTYENLVLKKVRDNYIEECTLYSEGEVIYGREVKKHTAEYESVIGRVKIKNILSVYDMHIASGVDFFAKNIRYPKSRHSFGNNLVDTLKKYPNNFYLFHNGLTMTASKITKSGSGFHICDPQIVNGGQTLRNISDMRTRIPKKSIDDATVLCKIVKADSALTDTICETSNTQRAVKSIDLRSNDLFQKYLEYYIPYKSNERFAYDRKATSTKGNIVDKGSLFQWANAVLENRPWESKTLKSKLFAKNTGDDSTEQYTILKKKLTDNLSDIVKLCEAGLFVSTMIASTKDKRERGLARDMNNHLVAKIYTEKTLDLARFTAWFQYFKSKYERAHGLDSSIDSGRYFKSSNSWS